MNWIEVSLQADGEAAEAIADIMHQYGYQGVAIEQIGVEGDAWEDELSTLPDSMIIRAYLPENNQTDDLKSRLESGLKHLHMIYPAVPTVPTYAIVKEEDWAEAWKAHYKPLRIGKQIYVRPEWLEGAPNDDDLEIILDPGMAFGTGTHPTTQLCLIALEAQESVAARVLDLGCGSGILAIAAAKLGATDIDAVDTDALAVKSTGENAERNGVHAMIKPAQGSLANLIEENQAEYGLILVNILAKIIIPMCEAGLGSVVAPGGTAIFSGLIHEQVEEVEAALRATGLTPINRRKMGDWVGIEAKREI